MAVCYGLTKFHQYTFGRDVNVITDHKPLVSIVLKPLSKAPRRLQNLLLRTQEYTYSLSHRAGTDIPVADALSRAPFPGKNSEEMVHNVFYTPIKTERLAEIRAATQVDDIMTTLKNVIMSGWPTSRVDVPPAAMPYFNYRDELTVQDGIILRGERVVIPTSLRPDIKQKVHAGHLGINSCLRRARELVFWPGMSSDIRQTIENCSTCAMFSDKQPPEPSIINNIPSRPYKTIATDLFSIEGRDYLVTVDCFSTFIEVDYMTTTTSEVVIDKLKQHIARHGIPDTIISDNGPQYSSEKFREFTSKYGIRHQTSSPGNSLMGRRTKTLIPTTSIALKPNQPRHTKTEMEDKRTKVAVRSTNRKSLQQFHPGDTVRVQPTQPGHRVWKKATVTQHLGGRSYEVATEDGATLRRNRQLLRAKPTPADNPNVAETTGETTPKDKQPTLPASPRPGPIMSSPAHIAPTTPDTGTPCAKPVTPSTVPIVVPTGPNPQSKGPVPYKTRIGRTVKIPARYKD